MQREWGEKRDAYKLLVGKPEGTRPVGILKRRWVDNIKMDLVEIGCGGVNWIGLVQDRDKWLHYWSPVELCSTPYRDF
jgi:hypothetical protein